MRNLRNLGAGAFFLFALISATLLASPTTASPLLQRAGTGSNVRPGGDVVHESRGMFMGLRDTTGNFLRRMRNGMALSVSKKSTLESPSRPILEYVAILMFGVVCYMAGQAVRCFSQSNASTRALALENKFALAALETNMAMMAATVAEQDGTISALQAENKQLRQLVLSSSMVTDGSAREGVSGIDGGGGGKGGIAGSSIEPEGDPEEKGPGGAAGAVVASPINQHGGLLEVVNAVDRLGTNQLESAMDFGLTHTAACTIQWTKEVTNRIKDKLITSAGAFCDGIGEDLRGADQAVAVAMAVATSAISQLYICVNESVDAGVTFVAGCLRGRGHNVLSLIPVI